MKQFFTLTLVAVIAVAVTVPALAVEVNFASKDQIGENVHRGAQNSDWAWTDVMKHSGKEASRFDNAGEHALGATVGGVIGVRRGIHRLGAGAIDLLTFWIPKNESLLDPANPDTALMK